VAYERYAERIFSEMLLTLASMNMALSAWAASRFNQ
jgi:hypothetical protein